MKPLLCFLPLASSSCSLVTQSVHSSVQEIDPSQHERGSWGD